MSNFALKTLEFGVLGLCAITLLLVWRVLHAEQTREGNPRTGILQASYVFMVFSLALAVLNGYVQLKEGGESVVGVKESETIVEKIKSGREFLIAFSVSNARETNCLTPENGSPIGDFLVGAAYKITYNKNENKLYTKGLNQGLAGCPWEDAPDARSGTDLDTGIMILWGVKFKFDEPGSIFKDGDHVGYILFPPV